MRLRYKSGLTFITIMILICSFLFVAYYLYDKYFTEDKSIIVVNDNLSINYLNGNKIIIEDNIKTQISFSVTNNNIINALYNIELIDVNNIHDDISFNLIGSNNINVSDVFPKTTKELSTLINIKSNETHNYTLIITNKNKHKISFRINIDSQNKTEVNFASLILENNKYQESSKTSIGEAATENEGLITNIDDSGVTYYYRGNITNNYVSFADYVWRIVRINGDGSVKLILDEALPTVNKYGSNVTDYKFSSTDIYETLNSWFDENLKQYEKFIKNYKYCDSISKDTDGLYFSRKRIATDNSPVFNCLGNTVSNRIGLITADEVMFAGGSIKKNQNYYLYNKDTENPFWTMTLYNMTTDTIYPFLIDNEGKIIYNVSGSLNRSIKPVIVVESNLTFIGSGLEDDPYIMESEN